jgi:tRNA(Arg) A34 adenosine deaminase TadA
VKHDKYFDILQKVAEAVEPVARCRLAACLVYKNQIVSIGTNKNKSHPFARRFAKHEEAIYLHAETDCIRNALKHISVEELSKCSMYVLRVKRPDKKPHNWTTGIAMPCEGCMKAIAQFDIKRVYYTIEEGKYECL